MLDVLPLLAAIEVLEHLQRHLALVIFIVDVFTPVARPVEDVRLQVLRKRLLTGRQSRLELLLLHLQALLLLLLVSSAARRWCLFRLLSLLLNLDQRLLD